MFLGINMFLAPLRFILAWARVKIKAEKGQKHIYAQEHQRYYYYNNSRGRLQQKRTNYQIAMSSLTLHTIISFFSFFFCLYAGKVEISFKKDTKKNEKKVFVVYKTIDCCKKQP